MIVAAKAAGATGVTILNARGEGMHEKKSFFGLQMEQQRDVLLFIVEDFHANPIIDAIKDVMLTDIKTVGGLTTIADVLKILKNETDLQTIVVEPRDDNDVYGLITLRDIARKVIAEGKRLNEVHAYEIMAKPVLTVNSTMSVMYAARFLANFDISRALVMDNDKLVGIISLNHIVLKCKLD